jgi:hypothetical protein
VRIRIRSLLLAPPLLLSAACGGGNGDTPSIPTADAYGSGARISDIFGEAVWLDPENLDSINCSIPPDRSIYVTGITIVAIDRFDETDKGQFGNYFVQDSAARYAPDEPAEYRGMTVYNPSFSPPDLRLSPGDVTDLLGSLTEFPGPSSGKFPYCRTLPELLGAMTFRFEGADVTPTTVLLEELMSYETARKYLGMLVRLESVTVEGTPVNASGRYTAPLVVGVPPPDVVNISNELYDLEAEGPPLALGSQFASVTGILTYFYGFKIAPRSPADFE